MYRLSFTAASFKFAESMRLAETYHERKDWKVVREMTFTDDLLQRGKHTTIQSEYRELELRLKTLTDNELAFLLETDSVSQRQLLWVAICRTYPFIRQFVMEVIRPNYQRYELELAETDYRRFFEQQANLHDELERLTESSKVKIRQVLFKMLEGAGLIASVKQRTILRPVLLDALTDLLRLYNPADLPLLIYIDHEL